MPRKKYCGMCDDLFVPAKDGDCPECGAGMETWPINPREKGEDDGAEYADPRDARDGRE